MSRVPMSAIALFALAVAIATAGLTAPTRAVAAHGAIDCGAGFDKCMAYCDAGTWGGPPASKPLGQCNDYCAQGTNICEAGHIPRPGGHPYHSAHRK
jgi:hypothetical protein